MSSAPTAAQLSENSDLIASLHGLPKKLVRSSTYPAPADPSIQIRSWKMSEYRYYDVPSPFPTLARGLFTKEVPAGDPQNEGKSKKTYEIVARGYDKFFNIGEVPWTTWPSIEANSAAPYTLSLKSNGCIIFIAALTPTKLLITSKHSIGPVAGSEVSHAEAGEKWLRKYLENKGKTEADLATRLWESNFTAVAELCDDSFEEHVLGYPPEKTGLHLHGLNVRSKEFNTLSTDLVDAFADEWGFIKTPTIVFNSIKEVEDFTNTCAETGEWNGEPVEGFVVRTHIAETPKSNDGLPYKPGESFFFKVKFDEPYMMYRDWREVTRTLLASKGGEMRASNLPKSKMKRAETKVYVKWVIEEIKKDRASFDGFAKGKGIIATREKFLKFLETKQGMQALARVKNGNETDSSRAASPSAATDKPTKTIIVPVAIPGCGKTSVSVALAHIFGFGHTQSDDIQNKNKKGRGPVFVKNVVDLLDKHDVVIADKCNHLQQHRLSLRDAVKKFPQPVRLLALNWSLDQPRATIHRICGDRVQDRGDNHQTLRADSLSKSHEDVIWMFINSSQELAPREVDNIVEMELGESLEDAVKRAVEGCVAVLGLEMPSKEKIQEGLDVVKGYTPALKKPDDPKDKKKVDAQYYGLLAEVDVEELLDRALANEENQSIKDFWKELKTANRVTKRPHVTIVHRQAIENERDLWNQCTALHEMSTAVPMFKGTLRNVLWDGRVMAIAVDDFDVVEAAEGSSTPGGSNDNEQGREFVSNLPDNVRSRLHITVGTRYEGIKAVEAKSMVEQWRKGEELESIKSIKLDAAQAEQIVYGRIKGLSR